MFFRVTLEPLDDGATIEPGWHGRNHRRFLPGGPFPREPSFTELLIELSLESARLACRPDAPSRLDCVFACETLADAVYFRDRYRQGAGLIYPVAPVSSAVAIFRGNFTAISAPADPMPYVDYMSRNAVDYWTIEPQQMVEVLIDGPVKVCGTAVTAPQSHPANPL